MIETSIHKDDGTELGKIRIEWLEDTDDDWSRYTVEFAVERLGAVGLHRRTFIFKRLYGNVLGLLKVALETLSLEELELENAPVGPSDLARRQRGIGAEVQGWPR